MIFVNALEQASLVSGFYTVAENVCNTTILKWCFGLPRPYVSSRTDYRKWRSLIRKWALMKTCHWSPFCISAHVLLYVKCDFFIFFIYVFSFCFTVMLRELCDGYIFWCSNFHFCLLVITEYLGPLKSLRCATLEDGFHLWL